MWHTFARTLRKWSIALVTVIGILTLSITIAPSAFARANSSAVKIPPQLIAAWQREGITNLPDAQYVFIKDVNAPGVSAPGSNTGVNVATNGGISPQWFCNCYEVHNVRIAHDGAWTFLQAATANGGSGGGHLTLSVNKSITNSRTNSGGVSATFINGQLGFNTSGTASVTTSYTIDVPAGQTWKLSAYAGMNVYTYDIYFNPILGDTYYVATDQAFQYDSIIHFVALRLS